MPRTQPSLRDLFNFQISVPIVETLGYCQPSLRDDELQIVVTSDKDIRARTAVGSSLKKCQMRTRLRRRITKARHQSGAGYFRPKAEFTMNKSLAEETYKVW